MIVHISVSITIVLRLVSPVKRYRVPPLTNRLGTDRVESGIEDRETDNSDVKSIASSSKMLLRSPYDYYFGHENLPFDSFTHKNTTASCTVVPDGSCSNVLTCHWEERYLDIY